MTSHEMTPCGRARAVLVLRDGRVARAVMTWVVVWAVACGPDTAKPKRRVLRVVGDVRFKRGTLAHVRRVVAPLANRILQALGVGTFRFELSVVSIDAATSQDLSVVVSDCSADGAVLAAMISAGSGIRLPEDLVITAQLASPEGHLAAVGSLHAKLAAATAHTSVRRFVHCLDSDGSRSALCPRQLQQDCDALRQTNRALQTIAVRDVAELLPAVLDEGEIALASLQRGFYTEGAATVLEEGPFAKAVGLLRRGNGKRFWQALEYRLLEGDSEGARELLGAYADYHRKREVYPSGIGDKLSKVLRSLPPSERRRLIRFPLLPFKQCLSLGMLAGQSDESDAVRWIDAALGRHTGGRDLKVSATAEGDQRDLAASAEAAVRTVLWAISAETLDRKIGLPLDCARASYSLDEMTVPSHDAFWEVLSSFYVHSARRSGLVSLPAEEDMVAAEAYRLLNDAFARDGGAKAAESLARTGIHSGLCLVLHRLADQLKHELKARHVDRVLREAVDPFNYTEKIEFMRALVARVADQLPPEIRARPVEDLVEGRDVLVQALVRGTDRIIEAFRGL